MNSFHKPFLLCARANRGRCYTSLEAQFKKILADSKKQNRKVYATGHSIGASFLQQFFENNPSDLEKVEKAHLYNPLFVTDWLMKGEQIAQKCLSARSLNTEKFRWFVNLNDFVCAGGLKALAKSCPKDIVIMCQQDPEEFKSWPESQSRFAKHIEYVSRLIDLLDTTVPKGATKIDETMQSTIMTWGFSNMEYALPMMFAHFVCLWSGEDSAPEKEEPPSAEKEIPECSAEPKGAESSAPSGKAEPNTAKMPEESN